MKKESKLTAADRRNIYRLALSIREQYCIFLKGMEVKRINIGICAQLNTAHRQFTGITMITDYNYIWYSFPEFRRISPSNWTAEKCMHDAFKEPDDLREEAERMILLELMILLTYENEQHV